ncbi:hypothetical protein [Chitinophaga skermanii]|nr:hypothetical protein [Chitinophaga skermanii]
MKIVPGGRYCDSCAHTVHDFTGFSDAALHSFLKDRKGKICGIFTYDQLDNALHTPPRQQSVPVWMIVGVLTTGTIINTQPIPFQPTTHYTQYAFQADSIPVLDTTVAQPKTICEIVGTGPKKAYSITGEVLVVKHTKTKKGFWQRIFR